MAQQMGISWWRAGDLVCEKTGLACAARRPGAGGCDSTGASTTISLTQPCSASDRLLGVAAG